jgi:hypothetical protein
MIIKLVSLSKKFNFNDEEREALLELAKDKSIANKGNAVVIQNISDYKRKVNKIIANKDMVKRLKENVTKLRENRLQVKLTCDEVHPEKRKPCIKYRDHRINFGRGIQKSNIISCGSRVVCVTIKSIKAHHCYQLSQWLKRITTNSLNNRRPILFGWKFKRHLNAKKI